MISAQLRKSFFYLFPKGGGSYRRAVPPHFFSSIAASENRPAKEKTPIAVYLKENGFSDTQLEKVLKARPRLRLANVEKSIKPKINVFKEFGFSDSQIAKIISAEPLILCTSAGRRLIPSLSLLQNLLGSVSEVVTIRKPGLRFLTSDLRKTLYPNIEFLKIRGLSMQRIMLLLSIAPGALSMKPEILRKHVDKLETFGMDSSSKMFIYALWVLSCMNDKTWQLKFRTFRNLGFADADILEIFRKAPQVFATSLEKIERIVRIILATKKYTVKSIVSNPPILWCSIDKRIKPRLHVLEILEKRKLIKKWPTLAACRYTDQKFHEKYVAPYPAVFTELKY